MKNNEIKIKFFRKKSLAISQICILIISILAFSYILSNNFGMISAIDDIQKLDEGDDAGILEGDTEQENEGMSQLFYRWGGVFRSLIGNRLSSFNIWDGGPSIPAITPGIIGVAIVATALIRGVMTLWATGSSGLAFDTALRYGLSGGVGFAAGYFAAGALGLASGPAGWVTFATAGIFMWLSKFLVRQEERILQFECQPWKPPLGGDYCDLCNHQPFPCTEYQCKSLGAACELINKNTDYAQCKSIEETINAPEINPWEEILTRGYRYEPLPRGVYGVEILYEDSSDGCLPAFQPFTFGVELDMLGYCRLEFHSTNNFSEMTNDFGGMNYYLTKHSQPLTFPGIKHLEREIEERALNITIDSDIEIYVRCESVFGRSNIDEFLFKFCIDDVDDITPPRILGFNWEDGSPVAYFPEDAPREVNIQVRTNKPAQCKWDWQDKAYENMENVLRCPQSLTEADAQLTYSCTGQLTGLENDQENDFYFRCNDTFGNVNTQSKKLTLIGTQPLVIESAGPHEKLIKRGTSPVRVTLEAETSAGYERGISECFYSPSGQGGSYIQFTNTDSHQHSTDIRLDPGNYEYYIRCIDYAGNSDQAIIKFEVEKDTTPPVVTRIYHEGGNLNIITDEEAECVYDSRSCSYDFEDGISMSTMNEFVHSVEWITNQRYYIKCRDEFGNRPAPNACTTIIGTV